MIDIETSIHEQAVKWGCAEIAALDFAKLRKDAYHEVNGVAIHNETSLQFDDPKLRAYWEQKAPHYFPRPVETSLADSAFLDLNRTALARLSKSMTNAELLALARTYGHSTIFPNKRGTRPADREAPKKGRGEKNPWSAEGWSIPSQLALCRAIGVDKANEIARAAGSFVGAVSPKSKRLIPT